MTQARTIKIYLSPKTSPPIKVTREELIALRTFGLIAFNFVAKRFGPQGNYVKRYHITGFLSQFRK